MVIESLPWKFIDLLPECDGCDPSYKIENSKGNSFVSDEDYYSSAPDKDSARFIVIASNAHHELLDWVKTSPHKAWCSQFNQRNPDAHKCGCGRDELIAKAQGQVIA